MLGKATASPRRIRPSGTTAAGNLGVTASRRGPQKKHLSAVSRPKASRSKSDGGRRGASDTILVLYPISGSQRTSTLVGVGWKSRRGSRISAVRTSRFSSIGAAHYGDGFCSPPAGNDSSQKGGLACLDSFQLGVRFSRKAVTPSAESDSWPVHQKAWLSTP